MSCIHTPLFQAMKAQRLYQHNLCRATMGLLIGMADIIDTGDVDGETIREFLTEIQYSADEDLFFLIGTRLEFLDLCDWLLKAAEISKQESFLDLASLLVAVLDEADSSLFSTARWN